MNSRCLIDTNVLIDYLAGDAPSALNTQVEAALSAGATVSVITTMELLGWRGHSAQSRRDAEQLLCAMGEVGITPAVVKKVVTLRSEVAIKLPDAIIAATAITEGLPLMTSNLDDFDSLPGLALINPAIPLGSPG